MAIASSHIFGCGPGNSVQRDNIPHSYSDFIYAIIIEELGLVVWMLSVPLFAAYFFAGEWLVKLFLDEPTAMAVQTGVVFLRIVSPFYFLISMKLVSDGILRGARLMNKFMIATFSDLLLRVALATVLAGLPFGATAIWWAWPIGWVLGTGLSVWFYRKGEWR